MHWINKYQKEWVFILSTIAWLAIDQITKYWAVNALSSKKVLIDNVLELTYQTNKGVAFGIEFGQTAQIIITVIIITLLIYGGFKWFVEGQRNPFLNTVLLGIIIGGALGNLLNRIQLGHVIDFIALGPIPVFNFADVGITLGLITLFLLTIRSKA